MKKLLKSILYDKRSENFIIALLILNILVFNFRAEQLFTNYIYIEIFDKFSMVVFTVEYAIRVCLLEKPKDFFKPMLMMDLLALLPYYLAFCPFKTTFIRIITGYGDFYPTATFGRIVDSIFIIICAGVHCLIIDFFAPAIIKYLRKKGFNIQLELHR